MKKVHRFILEIDLDARVEIHDANLLHQWEKVLKFAPGEELILCDGKGREGVYKLISLKKKTASLERIGEVRQVNGESERDICLYAAILKKDHFDWVIQKATECGVGEIVPLITDRTVKKGVKRSRLQEIAKEAAEQSGRGRIPTIHEPLSFEDALEHAANTENYFFHTDTEDRLTGVKSSDAKIGLFIGPEGGWTDEEVEAASKVCQITSLGPRILRGETACIVATYLAAN